MADRKPPRRPAERDEDDSAPRDEGPRRRPRLGKAGKAAGITAAAAMTAYGVYLLGASRGRRRPVTELPAALGLRIEFVPWGEVHYAYHVREGKGRPLVFLHGIGATSASHEMLPLVRAFQRSKVPLLALDWLGFGHSDRPELQYDPGVMEDQLEHFLERVVRPAGGADVVAMGLGATYAAEVARRRPDLVRSLVAIEPAGLGGDPAQVGRLWSRLVFSVPGVQRALYDRMTTPEALYRFAADHLFTPEFGVPEDFVRFGAETARVEGAQRPLDDVLSGRLYPPEATDTFRRLRQPVLVIHGTVESRRPGASTRLQELEDRPHVTLVGLPTGSLPHWERARETVARIRAFHDQLDDAPRSE